MKLIVCLDDKNGMAFYGRRQSADCILCHNMLELIGSNTLYMNDYSGKLFHEDTKNIFVDDHFMDIADQGDYCFAEVTDVTPYIGFAEEIIIYRWNRVYPSDLYFPIELLANYSKHKETFEFVGNSHDRITREVYYR